MTQTDPTVFVVDDDPAVLKATSRLLRCAGLKVAVFGSAQEFLDEYPTGARGCVMLDISMPGLNGLDLQRDLAERGSELPIIFLTGRADVPASVRAMKQGAVDLLTKPADEATLIRAVRDAIEKDRARGLERDRRAEVRRRLATLTPREREVLEQVISGKLNKQTAAELGTGEKTIKVHRARVMQKMGVTSLAELVRLAEYAGVACPLAVLEP
jgi:FixJ family two-component response regulator